MSAPELRSEELGGETACWAHLLDEDGSLDPGPPHVEPPLPDLGSVDQIEVLVREFYRRVAVDDVLGPAFAGMHVDWSEHLPKMVEFWSWQLLGVRGYEGQPLPVHQEVATRFPVGATQFTRWLELFDETIDEHFRGPGAEATHVRARKMAAAMQRLLAARAPEPADGVPSREDGTDPGDLPVSVTLTARPGAAR